MPTSQQIIEAQADRDLRARFVALAAKRGIQNPEHWVTLNMHALVAADLDGDGPNTDSVASVYDYAVATTPPRPGANPAAVTDDHIDSAIEQVELKLKDKEAS